LKILPLFTTRLRGLLPPVKSVPIGTRRTNARAVGELERTRNMLTILVVILLLMALGALPTWPHSRGWGYYPSGGLGLVVIILVILLLMGRI